MLEQNKFAPKLLIKKVLQRKLAIDSSGVVRKACKRAHVCVYFGWPYASIKCSFLSFYKF